MLAKQPNVKDKLDIKECLLPLNFGIEICKTVSRSFAGNQVQKNCTCITLNVCFVFNPSSIAVTFSSCCLLNWDA